MGCRWKRVWLCKQTRFAMVVLPLSLTLQQHSWIELDLCGGSRVWPLSAAARSSCHPAMRLACPTKPASLRTALCKLLLAQVSIQQSGRRRRQVNARLLAALFQCSQYWSAMTECQFMADFWPMVMAVTNLMATLAFVLSICVFLHLAHSLCRALGSNNVHM